MTLLPRLFIFSLLVTTFAFAGACVPQDNKQAPPVTQSTPAPSPAASPAATQANVKITLPLLHALLTDDAFERELKNRLKLTDDQVASLKRVSEAEIDRLRESNVEEANGEGTNGNGTAVPTRGAEELRSILGEEKAAQLEAFAHEYWAKGDPNAEGAGASGVEMLKGPNAVPTDTRVVVNIPAFRMDLF
ncbi:MAG TPA: hypothetical protein VFT02_00935, partial [Pyrinomonadaceae bacterium]|nr:hypothetical protein [Pyrinomonadaceae bacterium]